MSWKKMSCINGCMVISNLVISLVPYIEGTRNLNNFKGILIYSKLLEPTYYIHKHLDFSTRKNQLNKTFELIQQHEELLSETFLNGIMPYLEQNQIRLLGSRQSQNRTPTFALTMPNKPDKTAEGQSLIQVLNQNGILCTHGNHYAPDLVENCMNEPEGVTRISFLHYNSIADVNKVNFILSKFLDSCKNWTDNLKYKSYHFPPI